MYLPQHVASYHEEDPSKGSSFWGQPVYTCSLSVGILLPAFCMHPYMQSMRIRCALRLDEMIRAHRSMDSSKTGTSRFLLPHIALHTVHIIDICKKDTKTRSLTSDSLAMAQLCVHGHNRVLIAQLHDRHLQTS